MSRRALRDLVDRHAVADGYADTPIEGLQLFRVIQPIERLPTVYPASICCIVQGSKRVFLAGATHVYDPRHYLCVTMPLPMEAEVTKATPDEPLLGLLLSLETRAMAETLVEYEAIVGPSRGSAAHEPTPGLAVAALDDPFATALERLLGLLDDPVKLRLLGSGRLRELLFTIIEGEVGPLIRRTFGGSHDISRAISYLRENIAEPLSVDDLAAKACMSRTVFHRQFKAATTYSPLQFIKALRLSDAAMLITQGANVSQAADHVGYTSASQFSREFRRHFGKSPRQWGKTAVGAPSDVQATVV